MTPLLLTALEKASVLPDSLQDEIARELLEEIEWEQKWDAALEASPDAIDTLAEQARTEYEAGKTTAIGFDEL